MEGQILGNRYELLEKIGGGGMALVYKAKCALLNRYVAVKILRSEFTNDEEFVKRFVVEAQSAASLSHPNIVSIYDVGHEGNIHYIVMEYVNGITLKDYIMQKGVLDWRDAVNIAIQICSAIEHAHRNHIVHRDIKPHNILMAKEGIAKVTDFGIARAVSSSTITMTGSTIGSVHYFSPEQARGGYTDEKSDLYSLGIALYEMVTGKLPFDGETPVAVALKHLQVEPEPPVQVDSSIPKGVNDIIMKAIKKDQNRRYQTASGMLQDLYRVVREPNSNFVTEESIDESPTRRIKAISAEEFGIKDQYKSDYRSEEEGNKQVKKKDRLTIGLAVATSFLIIVLFAFITFKMVVQSRPEAATNNSTDGYEIKNYIGKNFNEVKEELGKYGITARDIRRKQENTDKDIIISQRIEPGKKLKPQNSIDFEVSDGPDLVKIANLSKTEYRTAQSALEGLGLITRVEEQFHDTIANGFVIKTDPKEGDQVKVGSVITIYKSLGPELKEVEVPNLVGLSKDQAMKAIADAKLKIGSMNPQNTSTAIGKVIKQEPEARTKIKEESPVNIYFEIITPPPATQRRIMVDKIPLMNPDSYPERMMVKVEIIPSDTNKVEILMIETKNKNDFPLTLQIPVPDKGSTRVRIYLNNSPTYYLDYLKP